MKLHYIFILFLAFTFGVKAQDNVADITALFSDATTVQWAVPISTKIIVPIEWQWRNSSFSQSGIRSFVGYYQGKLIGSLSVQSQFISGNVEWEGQSYLFTTEKGELKVSELKNEKCGTHNEPHSHSARSAQAEGSTEEVKAIIYSDNVLRYYRFALAIDYNAFVRFFNSDKQQVKSFWARAEIFLNELYNREVGVAFTMVNDDRLIVDSADSEIYKGSESPGNDVFTITEKLDRLISIENYDIGGMMTNFNFDGGYAAIGGVYDRRYRGALYTGTPDSMVLQHEVGHLFGSEHTFTVGGTLTYQTEPERGTSIMGYGMHYDIFFSLPSIYKIREVLAHRGSGYYADKERKKLVGVLNDNTVYGVQTHNQPPVIDRGVLKDRYTIPPDTNFQFYISAIDPDGDAMLYAAHQADFAPNDKATSKARFTSFPFSADSLIVFRDRWIDWYNVLEPYSYLREGEMGEFTFWLSASDGGYKGSNPHAVRYDMVETKLIVAQGTPFKITTVQIPKYNTIVLGSKVTINWGVDNQIFGDDSKVRILFSDDNGATFKYILAENVPNSGTAEVIIPLKTEFKQDYYGYVDAAFKVEVMDHIAFSEKKIGKTKLENSAITLINLPEPILKVKADAIPEKAEVIASSSCGSGNVILTYQEEESITVIKRTWTATDNCNNTVGYRQVIYIDDDKNTQTLQWVNAAEDMHIECKDAVPAASDLRVTGADDAQITFEETKIAKDDHHYTLFRRWRATAPKAAPIVHTQVITVGDTQRPELSSYPPDMTVNSYANVPSQEQLTATDNCDSNIEVRQYRSYDTINGKTVITFIWIAEDKSYNETRYEQHITIDLDFTPEKPLAFVSSSLPADIAVSCMSDVPAVEIPETENGCGHPKINCSDELKKDNDTKQMTIRRTFAATDNCTSEPITYTQIITVKDTIAPTFVGDLPQDITITEGDVIPQQATLTAIDNCGEVTVDTSESKEPNKITYQWVATDACGNQVAYYQVIIVVPRKELSFVPTTLPADVTVACRDAVPAVQLPQTQNNCGNAKVTYTDRIIEGGCPNNFVIERTFAATDDCTSVPITYTQIITVKDTIAPTFVGDLPQDITITEGDVIPQQATLTAIDNCGEVTVDTSESKEPNKITYQWVATDACGNRASYQQVITILPPIKLSFVAITLPTDVTVACSWDASTVQFPKTQYGCGNAKVTYSDKIISGGCPNNFTIQRTFSATDDCTSEPITYTQIITVKDTILPTFVGDLPQNITINEGDTIPEPPNLTATDNCIELMYTFIPSKKEEPNKITYLWEAIDACGNRATYSQVITIIPRKELSFVPATLPADVTVACRDAVPAVQLPQTQNNCGNAKVTYTDRIIEGGCPNNFVIERTFAATDDCTSVPITYTQIITVKDTIAPTFVGDLPQDITITEGDVIPQQATLTAIDNCGEVTVDTSESKEPNKITYQWVATDACGNRVAYSQVIIIVPKEAIIYNAVSTTNPYNYFNITETDKNTPISVIIFDEMGLKVYENDNYGNPGYFSGYSNTKGVIGNKPLKGTYFYIVRCYINGNQEVAKGYLYVK